ncbi:orotidine-5'-phosphate decarboxylase [Coxiella endosymbiont of Amblyomma americanum]|uniref:orotidine-5'-phosphate decarboxylase n=1 Tax=Coxiella endosymbiont of Amblyomma americanum TaxID=325775 RepID=UPI00057ECA8E|nr:orotidine-5'-phosphate decarboxylase [Coxiella endosymbiont of Amblyomma americanum]AJC50647.1 orotidine 5'-phosphate decarboxylase [Coxiella endosymbiont of Amblyomma americanum]AUJ58976.1 orotidine-5'-phosphate decarboxylase [Coxiella-like endosymbiont of Amblyomma americanum]
MTKKKEPKIIVAIDSNTREEVDVQIQQLDPTLCHLKIGNILFTRYGPPFIEELIQKNYRIFLDLKFHDIPKVAASACRAAALLGVWMVDVHILGGRIMLETVMDTLKNTIGGGKTRPIVVGVTALTSLDASDFKTLGIHSNITSLVARMAILAKESGLDGVVCSAKEAAFLRKQQGKDFLLVTPGIRLSHEEKQDQKRTMTPRAAIKAGSDYLVIGRSIMQLPNPREILQNITYAIFTDLTNS